MAVRRGSEDRSIIAPASVDHGWNCHNHNGWRTFSNESGGVWTCYFHVGQARKPLAVVPRIEAVAPAIA